MENEQVKCQIGSYELTVEESHNLLTFRALSESAGRLFEGHLPDDSLPKDLRNTYQSLQVIYTLLTGAMNDKNVVLKESGELSFRFLLKCGTVEIPKEISVQLKELELDHIELLKRRIERVEHQLSPIKNVVPEID